MTRRFMQKGVTLCWKIRYVIFYVYFLNMYGIFPSRLQIPSGPVRKPLLLRVTDRQVKGNSSRLSPIKKFSLKLNSYFFSCLFCVQELPLYCSGGLRFFWDNKFDHAMVAFLDCVQQFKEEVEKGDTGFCLPYRSDTRRPVLCRANL